MKKPQKKLPVVVVKRKQQELSFVMSQLDSFATVVSYGFSDNNWTIASRIYNNLRGHLLQSDREKLADIWREAFVCKNEVKTTSAVSNLKARINAAG